MKMLKTLLVATAMTMVTASAIASDAARAAAKDVIELKDGVTLYVFKDGKMAMEDKNGRAVRMQEGTSMETKDGKKFIMNSDEVARMSGLLKEGHKGGH